MALFGTVISGAHNIFTVECEDGTLRQCAIKGKVLKTAASQAPQGTSAQMLHNALAPGDIVCVEDTLITSLVPRHNCFSRWNDKSLKRQVLAANVDVVLLVTTPASPPFRPRFIDRALVQCDADGLTAWAVCNKCDLDSGENTDLARRLGAWQAAGIRVFRVSAADGTGVAKLQDAISTLGDANKKDVPPVAVLVGQSGVGKSSLVNALCNDDGRRTGGLCAKYDRGAHTTAMGELVKAGGGGTAIRLIDTPGVRRFALHDVAAEDLALHFAEMAAFVGKCRYGMSCTHTVEEGCAIRQAVEAGRVSAERYDSYLRVREEIESTRRQY